VCVYVCARECVCVYIHMCERERETETEKRWRGIYSQVVRGWTELEDRGADWRTTLKWIFKKLDREAWIELMSEDRNKWRGCEYGDELSGSIKCGEFID